jgi:carbonic anhydrase
VFVCRNAGNLWGASVGGTAEYAVNHLGIKLIVVMGHQGCGAVKASRLPTDAIMKEPELLRNMLFNMKDGLAYCSETLDDMKDAKARDRESVFANAIAQVDKIKASPDMGPKVARGEIVVVAAFYEITSGIVDFVDLSSPPGVTSLVTKSSARKYNNSSNGNAAGDDTIFMPRGALITRQPAARAAAMGGAPSMYTSVLSMEEARALQKVRNAEIKVASPYEILEDLKAGNARFWTGQSEKPDMALVARSALIDGQAPKVMVLGCADSRVPIEIVFDQGLGTRRARPTLSPFFWRDCSTSRAPGLAASAALDAHLARPSLHTRRARVRPRLPPQATSSSAATRATSGAPPSAARPSTPSTTSASSSSSSWATRAAAPSRPRASRPTRSARSRPSSRTCCST